MKTRYNTYAILFLLLLSLGCKNTSDEKQSTLKNDTETQTITEGDDHANDEHSDHIELSTSQLSDLNITIDTISNRNMSGYIEVNGTLGVPPQNEAVITTTIGANISQIKVIEGDYVKKGQVVAYITHPDIITIQTDYLQTLNKLSFLEQDFKRQQTLYDQGVASGRDYQQAKSTFNSTSGLAKGYASQLRLLGLSPQQIEAGNIAESAPLRSPINGYIEKVFVKSGQYAQPQTPLIEIVNTEHIHLDLMVYEKDISKVKNGQTVRFNVESIGNTELTAKIYSVGKTFEDGPKALHIHAEIENKNNQLIPGMYVNAQIITENTTEKAIAESAIFRDGAYSYVFVAKKINASVWEFTPEEILIKNTSNGFSAFQFKKQQETTVLVAQSGAYYLISELKKGEAEHSH
ncbi:MAG: efflux RND transporter periplasmic adaptor subunit [Bizionia sp.]|nr:efflux RND transporter periplasmic adaptor subunit [Bizionia sp.]